jgi:hypothetical protein
MLIGEINGGKIIQHNARAYVTTPRSKVYLFFNPKYMRTKEKAKIGIANHSTVQSAERYGESA